MPLNEALRYGTDVFTTAYNLYLSRMMKDDQRSLYYLNSLVGIFRIQYTLNRWYVTLPTKKLGMKNSKRYKQIFQLFRKTGDKSGVNHAPEMNVFLRND